MVTAVQRGHRYEYINSLTTGDRRMVLTDVTVAPFVVGEVITDDSNAAIHGIVTKVTGVIPNQQIEFYHDNVPNVFTVATGAFTGGTSGATATAVAVGNIGLVVVPPRVGQLTVYSRVSAGSPITGNSVQMTVSSAQAILERSADWFEIIAALTNFTNLTFNNTTMYGFGENAIGGLRILRNELESTEIELAILGA